MEAVKIAKYLWIDRIRGKGWKNFLFVDIPKIFKTKKQEIKELKEALDFVCKQNNEATWQAYQAKEILLGIRETVGLEVGDGIGLLGFIQKNWVPDAKHTIEGQRLRIGFLEESEHALKCVRMPFLELEVEFLDGCRKTLEGLTPGGSEFFRDPEFCEKHIRERFHSGHEVRKELVLLKRSLKRGVREEFKAINRWQNALNDKDRQIEELEAEAELEVTEEIAQLREKEAQRKEITNLWRKEK